MSKKTIEMNGRTFECYYSPEFSGKACSVSIYEVVRPSWKIFRTAYRAYKVFWLGDYKTIREGIIDMIECYLCEEEEQNNLNNKWREINDSNN